MLRDVFYYGEKPNAHPREKYATSIEDARSQCTTEHFWIINEYCDYRSFDWDFDFEFLPDEDVWAEEHNNVWPSQHQKDSGKWLCPKQYSDIVVYRADVIVKRKNEKNSNWVLLDSVRITKFDFSWHPDVTSPPYIYQFGTIVDKEDGPKYAHPEATDGVIIYLQRMDVATSKIIPKYFIETTLEDLVKDHSNEIFWAIQKNIDYTSFNFDWRPEIVNVQWENEYVYVFGSIESEITQTYFVNSKMYFKGYTDYKFVHVEELTEKYLATLFKKSDMFFVDRSNNKSQERFEKLKQRFPTIQKTRYLNSWVDTISRCINRSTTELCWILNSEVDYADFDFEYYPNPWQMKMVHVFGTQWSHWGNTYLVNRDTFIEKTKYVKQIEHIDILNFVKTKRTRSVDRLYDIVLIGHGNKHDIKYDYYVEYENSYLNTFKKILDILPEKREHHVWVLSSICDYSRFDFTYICDPYTKTQLHVFPTNHQKFGDTFLVDVNKLRELIAEMTSLESYEKVNYNQHQRVNRLPAPIVNVSDDTHCDSLDIDYDFPYVVLQTEDIPLVDTEPMSLWDSESKIIKVLSEGATQIIVPKEAKTYVKKELYDYPYIKKSDKLAKSKPLDIIFFSNGESIADKNYEHLLNITKNLPNKVRRIDGVDGRVKSQHAAANSSETSWYFLVNAKLKVSSKFNFNWQPDRLQIAKHYIFRATNPVNGLVYGHQAIVANNKRLTLNNNGVGLDFTMDSEHEVVDINSGIALYNTNEWDTWRTAFRECIKLKKSGTSENNERLHAWLTMGIGEFAQYSLQGARHAIEYYEEVSGDFDKLRLSYDWGWLRTYYQNKYKS
jgi:hypothetical protein